MKLKKEFQSTLPSQGATNVIAIMQIAKIFQSTLPSQGATKGIDISKLVPAISIHAPLTGSDKRVYDADKLYRHFNPRSPHRERPVWTYLGSQISEFQSTLPSQGATDTVSSQMRRSRFQSTLPSQGATKDYSPDKNLIYISIHAPLTGSD